MSIMAETEHVALNGKIYMKQGSSGLTNDSDYQMADFRGAPSLDLGKEIATWKGQSRVTKSAMVTQSTPLLTIPEVAFDPDTLALVTDMDIIRKPAAKRVTATVKGATESTLTVEPDPILAFEDNEQCIISDSSGWFLSGYIDGVPPSTTTVKVDDGAGALITDIEHIGVKAQIDSSVPQYFTRADNALLDIGNAEDYSLLIRFERSRETQVEVLMAKSADYDGTAYGTTAGWVLFIDVLNQLNFAVNDGVDAYILTSSVEILKDVDYFVAVTFDESAAANCKIYINGYDQTTTRTGTLSDIGDCSNAGVFSIGAEADGGVPFDGKIYDAAVYSDVVLTAVHAIAYAAIPRTEAGAPDAWWPFTGDAADTTWDDEATAANSLDLTLVGVDTTNIGTHSRIVEAVISANFLNFDWAEKQSGIGGWTTGDAESDIRKDSQYVKHSGRSLRVKNTDASQAFARATVVTIAGVEYHFHGWFRAPETPNGASALVLVDSTANMGITVTQAGATTYGTWYEVEFDFEAGDASTTIALGSGSVTDTEQGYWENVSLCKNYVDAGGFETDIAGSDWATTGAPTVDDADTTEDTGTLCYKINSDTPASKYVSQAVTVTSGEVYTFTGRVKCGTAEKAVVVLSGAASVTLDNGADTTNYVTVRHEFTAATTTLTIKIYGDGADARFDNFSVCKVDEKEYRFDDELDLVDSEFILEYYDNDGKINHLYGGEVVVPIKTINFSNEDFVVHDLDVYFMTSFVHYFED
jgi:hypothetical protein